MSRKLDRVQIAGMARIATTQAGIAHPPRTFELPARLYGLTVGAYLAFLAVTAVGFASPGLIIPIAICVIYLAMAFGTPLLWARMRPEEAGRALSWNEFRRVGVMTATGRLEAGQAALQVLILPVLILAWGVTMVALYAVLG